MASITALIKISTEIFCPYCYLESPVWFASHKVTTLDHRPFVVPFLATVSKGSAELFLQTNRKQNQVCTQQEMKENKNRKILQQNLV